MVDVKIDLSKKTEEEVMALIEDLTHYVDILSATKVIKKFRNGIGYYDERYDGELAIKEFNKCIVKYCESNYVDGLNENENEQDEFI